MTYDAFTHAAQVAFAEAGFDPGPEDGMLGPRTMSAAQSVLVVYRGVYPQAQAKPISFTGAAKRLDDIDLPRIGAKIGVGEDEIHALIDVEAAGKGFDGKGRPSMLFEPHIFWRELGAGSARDRAHAEGLAYPKWRRSYPKDSYSRLEAAIEIDENAALRSASWGLGQVMGFNCRLCGYDTARDMVEAMTEDEEHHLEAMVDYIVSAGLDDELRRGDWAGFARGYNGPAYATHGYHTKLRASFIKWSAIPDTPYDPDVV